MRARKKSEENPMELVNITRSGRLNPNLREPGEIHNMPEEGDEGIENEYSSNLPEARKYPDPVSTDDIQKEYIEWTKQSDNEFLPFNELPEYRSEHKSHP